jgi:hypothetical protein
MPKSEPIDPANEIYIGDWKGENESEILIGKDGSGSFKYVVKEGNNSSSKSAKPANVQISKDKLIFTGPMNITFELKIDAAPAKDSSGQYSMVIDGLKFTR